MIQVPAVLEPAALADWIEANLLFGSDERLSDADITDALDEADTNDVDLHLANIRTEVRRRVLDLGSKYPIRRDGLGFARTAEWKRFPVYSFLLTVSLCHYYTELRLADGAASEPAEIFELFARDVLAQYVGGWAVRFGAHRRPPVPSALPEAVRYVSALLCEICTYGQIEEHHSGDDGLDIVAAQPFPDGQPSQLIVLAQCAIGSNWRDKRSELDLELWRRHIQWATQPVKAFVVPISIERSNTWSETAARGGIIFDRSRLLSLIGKGPKKEMKDRMLRWSKTRLRLLNRLQ